MVSFPETRVTLVGEIKNPWLVTPQQIDAVIDGLSLLFIGLLISGTAPVRGLHPGRLAVEQLYGYMTRNAKTYGILTTLRGWCFAYRRDGGELFLTRMYGFGPEAPAGYYQWPISIMLAIYYLSRVAHDQPDLGETTQGQPGYIYLPYAIPDQTSAAPHRMIVPLGQQQNQVDQAYQGGGAFQAFGPFEPWRADVRLGPKSWIVKHFPSGNNAVLKLWVEDDDEKKRKETESYQKLQPLWGDCVPSFFGNDILPNSNSIAVQYVEVLQLIRRN
jgi:hypothetical protein